MTREQAIWMLERVGQKQVKAVYSWACECLLVLCPHFEYPNWDYRTVREFLKVYGKMPSHTLDKGFGDVKCPKCGNTQNLETDQTVSRYSCEKCELSFN